MTAQTFQFKRPYCKVHGTISYQSRDMVIGTNYWHVPLINKRL